MTNQLRRSPGVVVALIAVTYVVTSSARGTTVQSVTVGVQLLTVWIIFGVSESQRAQHIAAIAIAIGTGVALILGSVRDEESVARVMFVLSALLYLIAPVIIVRHIFRRDTVSGQTVVGAISAYLLPRMMFAFCFAAIAAIQSTPPFYGAQGPGSPSQELFFSFVTLTTTG